MNNWLFILAAPLLFATAAKADESIIQTDQVRVTLTAEHKTAAPGQTIWVALSFDLKPGWHTYWRTPGDAGEPVTVNWTLPAGVSAGAIQWPIPERFDYSGIAGFGYLGHATLLTALKVDPSVVAPSTLSLKADATWLACSGVCVPDEGSVSIPLQIEAGGMESWGESDNRSRPEGAAAPGALADKGRACRRYACRHSRPPLGYANAQKRTLFSV